MFGHANGDRVTTGGATDVGNGGQFLDVFDLLVRFDRADPHRWFADVHELGIGERGFKLGQEVDAHFVELDPDALSSR